MQGTDDYDLLQEALDTCLAGLANSLTSDVEGHVRYLAEFQGKFRVAAMVLVDHSALSKESLPPRSIEAVRKFARLAGVSEEDTARVDR